VTMVDNKRLFIKVTRDSLPQVKDKYPFLYLERGRLEIDDSSIKWIDSEGNVVPLPVATLNCLLLGPGTSITHDAVKTSASANCSICWVGEDSLLFYAAGISPTSDSKNLKRQIELASNKTAALEVARRMFSRRFPGSDLEGKTLKEMMGTEGHRIRELYQSKAEHYKVGWKGRDFVPGKFDLSDSTNQILSACNAALYGIICSGLHSLGYSPYVGFVHSGSPLPFVYDVADLYKEHLCIDLSFALTREMAGRYNKHKVSAAFRKRVIDMDLLSRLALDVPEILGVKDARGRRK